jgi:hypothetical protein
MNTINEFMDLIHNNPDPSTHTPTDIDALIAYHRANREGGLRPTKNDKVAAPKVTLADLGFKPSEPVKGKVFRR